MQAWQSVFAQSFEVSLASYLPAEHAEISRTQGPGGVFLFAQELSVDESPSLNSSTFDSQVASVSVHPLHCVVSSTLLYVPLAQAAQLVSVVALPLEKPFPAGQLELVHPAHAPLSAVAL